MTSELITFQEAVTQQLKYLSDEGVAKLKNASVAQLKRETFAGYDVSDISTAQLPLELWIRLFGYVVGAGASLR